MNHPDLDEEQAYLDALYQRLETEIEKAEQRLSEVRIRPVGGSGRARFEREAFARHLEDRVALLRAHRRDDLCFGRIDSVAGDRYYIGRVGLADDDHEPLLVDWRAPAAAAFYQATPREPLGVARRRHFLTRDRKLAAVEDEVLDGAALPEAEAESLRGEAALQYVMSTARTGRMREIAATIQREQDEVIRAPMTPAVLVQGGPGTGKTAVALHRAAYLLYTYRRHLGPHDVLVVGPNRVFLRYIENVLPSLGQTGAQLHAVPQVYARRDWAREEEPARSIKARPVMVEVISRAIATRRRSVTRAVVLEIEGERVRIPPSETARVVAAARRRRGRHNATAAFVHDRLLRLVWERAGSLVHDRMEFEDFRAEWLTHPEFRRLAMRVWPALRPEELLNDLFGFPALLEEAGSGLLPDADVAALVRRWSRRVEDVRWTDADAPLLDEADRQLGPIPEDIDPETARRGADRERVDEEEARAEAEYTRQLMSGLGGGIVPRRVLEERLAGRARDPGDEDDGSADSRRWRYGVVDEAQDVSPMAWRMVGRHCPRRAMTVVGDLAQGTEPWSPESWDDVRRALELGDEARVAELTVNYRTPSEIAEFAAEILAVATPGMRPPTPARSVPGSLVVERVPPDEAAGRGAAGAVRLREELGEGIACVIAAPATEAAVRDALERLTGSTLADPTDPRALDAPFLVTTPALAKGLEFDVVVLVTAEAIVAQSGWSALYVSATRATRRLLVVHTGLSPLPTPPPHPDA